jgi:hypothetical protein
MKRALIVILGLLLAAPALAQDPCKGVKIKDDKFGGGSSAIGIVQQLGKFRAVGMFLRSQYGIVELQMTVKEGGAVGGKLSAGTEMVFRFEGGQVLTLATHSDASPRSYVSDGAVMTTVPYAFALTPEELQTFVSSPLLAVRVPVISTGTTFDWEANSGVQTKLKAFATCMAGLE